jgi:hypothetical protein
MAGTATSTRRWVLPTSLLVVMLMSYGKENATASYRGGAGRGQYWKCEKCGWIERWPRGSTPPRCEGGPGDSRHPKRATVYLEGEDHKPSGGPRRFKR